MAENIHQVLQKYWGFDEFRPLQEDIINSILQGNDTLALMPTGGGKSICFQVPALAQDGICLVITPLIALMKDQVENLVKKNIKATAVYSGMSNHEIDVTLDNCAYGKYKFLYLSPERLHTGVFVSRAHKIPVNLIAVDEAHCISEWGYDFRPSYLKIAEARNMFPKVPVLALTATATPEVRKDITAKLNFKNENVFVKSFERKNLIYAVVNDENKDNRILQTLKKVKGTGIIYARNRKTTKDISAYLNKMGISADYYHGGLDSTERSRKQDNWINNKTRIMLATNAFGMGIDKPDVRVVLHYDMPDSLESYYQEAGRGGRDLKKSFAIAIVNNSDKEQLEKRINLQFPEIEIIKNTYHALGNYFQIPLGSGLNQSYDFDISDFCNRYNLKPINVYNVLNILEKEGIITTTDAVFLPSRLIFIISYKDLYEFQVANRQFDSIIKVILRSYGGSFDNYVKINEYELAKRMEITKSKAIAQLEKLNQLKVIDYRPSRDKPQIIFNKERLSKDQLPLDYQHLNKRKKIFKHKIESILNYIFTNSKCRSKMLLTYFGETPENNCGHCDHCLKANENTINEAGFQRIKSKIIHLLKIKKHYAAEIENILHDEKKEGVQYVLKWMSDNNEIEINKDNTLKLK